MTAAPLILDNCHTLGSMISVFYTMMEAITPIQQKKVRFVIQKVQPAFLGLHIACNVFDFELPAIAYIGFRYMKTPLVFTWGN